MLAVGPFDSWEDVIRLVAALAGSYWAILWLSAIVWTFRDVRERAQDSVSQVVAVLLVLVFSVFGLLLYLILRPHQTLAEAYERSLETEAMLQEVGAAGGCPSCGRRLEADFLYCPNCAATVRERCAGCDKPVLLAWNACPYCGTSRRARPAAAASPFESPPAETETPAPLSATSPPQPPF